MSSPDRKPTSQGDEFARAAARKRDSFVTDYLYLLKTTKKWWMLPLIVLLLALGALMILSSTVAAPFIYTLF